MNIAKVVIIGMMLVLMCISILLAETARTIMQDVPDAKLKQFENAMNTISWITLLAAIIMTFVW